MKKRQGEIECMSVTIRGALRRNGRLPRYLLSGLLVCGQCGGTFRRVNTREYGCASHVDGGHAACTNGIRVRGELAESKLLEELQREILSPEGIALLESKVRENMRGRRQLCCMVRGSLVEAVGPRSVNLQ